MKCARVRRAVPCDSLGSAALNRGICALYCCLSKKRSMMEPHNAEPLPKCSKCHHPGSVVPSSGYLLWTLSLGNLSSENRTSGSWGQAAGISHINTVLSVTLRHNYHLEQVYICSACSVAMRRGLCCSIYAVHAKWVWWRCRAPWLPLEDCRVGQRQDRQLCNFPWKPPTSNGWTLSCRGSGLGPKPDQELQLKQDGPQAEQCWGLPNSLKPGLQTSLESAARGCLQWSRKKLWLTAASTGWNQDGCVDISVSLEFLFIRHFSATVTWTSYSKSNILTAAFLL